LSHWPLRSFSVGEADGAVVEWKFAVSDLMLRRVLSASTYGRLVKRYPFVKVLMIVVGIVRWLMGRQRLKAVQGRILDVDLADDEVLVLTREKVAGRSAHGTSTHE